MDKQNEVKKPSYRKKKSLVTYKAKKNIVFNAAEIVNLRKSYNMSQREFAEALGVVERTVTKWELQESMPAQPIQNLMYIFSIDRNAIFQFVTVIKKK